MDTVTVSIEFKVRDPDAVVYAARQRAINDGIDPIDAEQTYHRRSIGACLQLLLDPGAEIPGAEVYANYAG